MREAAIIFSILFIAIGLRLSKTRAAKKLGALTFLIAMGYMGYTLASHWIGAFISVTIWFLYPLLEILGKKAKEQYPVKTPPLPPLPEDEETFFPHASSYRAQLEDLGFDEVKNHSWRWLKTNQHHRFFWNPELHTVASICLCEHEKIAYTFIVFHSELSCETILRTTNYPFTSPLIYPPDAKWNHVPCEERSITAILKSHTKLIQKHNPTPCQLMIPDPESIDTWWLNNYDRKIQYNQSQGLIKLEETTFSYTPKGLFQLWILAVKDLIRLC